MRTRAEEDQLLRSIIHGMLVAIVFIAMVVFVASGKARREGLELLYAKVRDLSLLLPTQAVVIVSGGNTGCRGNVPSDVAKRD
jgi:hypothetical protein